MERTDRIRHIFTFKSLKQSQKTICYYYEITKNNKPCKGQRRQTKRVVCFDFLIYIYIFFLFRVRLNINYKYIKPPLQKKKNWKCRTKTKTQTQTIFNKRRIKNTWRNETKQLNYNFFFFLFFIFFFWLGQKINE